MELHLQEDDLNACVQCGLCLPHCPTFRVTGDESRSPRGRIKLMREVQNNDAPLTTEVVEAFDTCVQCRGCEPACPSEVPYGKLIEQTRETLLEEGSGAPRWQQLAMKPLGYPRLLRAGSTALATVNKLGLVPSRFGLPKDLPVRREPLQTSGSDVWMFTGCVMDAWQRDVHLATQHVIEAAGFGVEPTGDLVPCCGALHTHAGMAHDTRGFAEQMIDVFAIDDRPILVNSAGCGAAMKEYGSLLGTDAAAELSSRVFDVHEWLADHVDQLPEVEPLPLRVAIQDPCHLRHVQRVHQATRDVLAPFVADVVELDDDGLCCGAGGAYSVLQPELAGDIRDRKIESIERTEAEVVASANPGCGMHLAAEGVETVHPMELVARALQGKHR